MADKVVIKVDNTDKFIGAMEMAKKVVLTEIGMQAEKYAKALCPVGTVESTGKKGYRGGTLRNSITYEVGDDVVAIGSNVEYAPYVELGTGPYFNTPPEWESFGSDSGSGGGHGYVKPRPYLKPAIEDHLNEYKDRIKSKLSNA